MMEQIPFVIMTVLLLAVLFVTHVVITGEDHDTDEPDERTTHPQE